MCRKTCNIHQMKSYLQVVVFLVHDDDVFEFSSANGILFLRVAT